jgi:DNA invertase Pin-like site-specific DNA recombinase
MHGLTIDRIFSERGVSRSTPLADRLQGAALLEVIRQGDIVITPKLDRMFRSATDALANLERMRKLSVHLHMIDLGGDVTGIGIAKLVFTIPSALAEAERDRIRERIATVKADQKARKRYLGGKVPFGYRVGDAGELVEDAQQQEAIREMARQRDHEKLSLRSIVARMQDRGFPISHEGMAEVLRRAQITG